MAQRESPFDEGSPNFPLHAMLAKLVRSVVLATALVLPALVLPAHAITRQPTPLVPARSAPAIHEQNYAAIPSVVNSVSPEKAKTLLLSTEGSAWRVLRVTAPACSSVPVKPCRGHGTRAHRACKVAKQAARKQCAVLRTECNKARKIARNYSAEIVCSPLYSQTAVLLSTASPYPQNRTR